MFSFFIKILDIFGGNRAEMQEYITNMVKKFTSDNWEQSSLST